MNTKNLKLFLLLIVLAAAAYAYQGPYQDWREKSRKPKNMFSALDAEKISKISIASAGKTTELERLDGRLRVGGSKGFFVRQDIADDVLKKLKEAGTSDLSVASVNPDKKSDFQLEDPNVLRISLFEGDATTSEFLVGGAGSDFTSAYVALPDIKEIYRLNVNLRSLFDREEWRDTTIFSSDREKITKIRFQYPTREFTVEKKDGSWQGTIPKKFEVKAEKLEEILAIMSNLTSQGIPDQSFNKTGLEKSAIIVQATGEGVDNTIMIGKEDGKERYFAKRSDSDNIYLVSKEQVRSLDKRPEDLK